MPSEKSLRVERRKAARNTARRGAARSAVNTARRAIASGDVEEAQGALSSAASALDKAAKDRVIHRNNAARRKARLAARWQKRMA